MGNGRRPRRSGSEVSPAALGGGRLLVLRVIWAVLALILAVFFVANLPTFLHSSQTICTASNAGNCPTGQLTPTYVHALHRIHASVALAAGILAALVLAISLLYWAVGVLIFWRKAIEWFGLLTSFLLVMLGAVAIGAFSPLPGQPLINLVGDIVDALLAPSILLFVLIFPTGRFTPRWTWIVFALALPVWSLPNISLGPPILRTIVAAATLLIPIVVQIYRYRRVYDAVQRQQTKWFVIGVSAVIAVFVVEGLIGSMAARSAWYQLLSGQMWLLVWTILLASVSIPILRYRLWDIDVLVNRTLVYVSLTGSLAAIYLGAVVGFQSLFRAVTGQDSGLAVALSTLIIAALFNPLRHRIQDLIARTFYRRRYDAGQVLAAFGATCRDETDLEELRAVLLRAVGDTVQPFNVSLWLAGPLKDAES
jgi:hypothetical protein